MSCFKPEICQKKKLYNMYVMCIEYFLLALN